MMELRRSKEGSQQNSCLGLPEGRFGFFRRSTDRVSWEAVLKGKGVQEGWTCFKKEIVKLQVQAVPT